MNEKYYQKIKEMADEAYQSHETIKRADVAFELGVPDSNALSGIIYMAYDHYKAESIRQAIVTNQENKSVVESYELTWSIARDKRQDALERVEHDLQTTDNALAESQSSIANALQLELAKDAAELAKYFQGSNGLQAVQSKATALMQNYGKMVDDYQNAELCVKNDIHDFVQLRSAVNALFLQYGSALVDIFGESIKMIAPNLFDFDKVQWLDTDSMQKNTQLEYNKLDENCTLLIGEIAQSFDKTLNQLPVWMMTSKALGSKGGIYGTLVMGALSYINHIVEAGEKTTRMQREYQTFEDSVKRDRYAINSDLIRLATIHKTINDLYIPKASAFVRLSNNILNDDLQQLLDSFYTGSLQSLKKKREDLIRKCRQMEQSINDHQESIALFEGQIKDRGGLIETQKENYEKAKSSKPAFPNIFSRIFTLGFSRRKYEEQFLVWNEKNGKFVTAYEDALADVDESRVDLDSHKELLAMDKELYDKYKKEIEEISQKIAHSLDAEPEKKMAVLKHLKNMIGLLRAAKAVTESKMDDTLLKPSAIPTLEDYVHLPVDIEEKVTNFTQQICEEAEKKGVRISEEVRNELGLDDSTGEAVSMTQNIVKRGAQLIDSWTHLQAQEIRSQLTDAVYQSEMEKLKSEFQKTMQQIDQKSSELREMLQIANTTVGDNDAVRKALMQMAGIPEEQLTAEDFEAILQNKKTITL